MPGPSLARDHRLTALGWLIEAAFVYTDDSVWGPLTPPTATTEAPDTPADALAELLTAITRRQREHRQHTADRLTAVLDTGLLPDELTEMALYYRAKAHINTRTMKIMRQMHGRAGFDLLRHRVLLPT